VAVEEPRLKGDGRVLGFLPLRCREVQRYRSEGERGQGGPGGEENGDDGGGDTATASGLRSMTFLQKTPSSLFSFIFQFYFNIQKLFLDLFEVLKYFRKFCKYLWGLPITCRSSTKIGIAK
jgi:hypothetical protein